MYKDLLYERLIVIFQLLQKGNDTLLSTFVNWLNRDDVQ